MSITYKSTINNYWELDDLLWSGAYDRWKDATAEQKKEVFALLEDIMCEDDMTLTAINDFIWFECDNIFFPEEDDECDNS